MTVLSVWAKREPGLGICKGRIGDRLFPHHFFVGSDFAIANKNDAVGMLRDVHFMGYQNDGISLLMKICKQPHNFFACFGVQISRRLVG